MIKEEIKMLFSNSDVDAAYSIKSVGESYPAYVVRFSDSFGVAVPYDGEEINEGFAHSDIYSAPLVIGDNQIQCLFLTSSIECTRNEFASFCAEFVDVGENGTKRKDLISNPVNWWRNWRQLIGNAITEKKPYAVIGELIAYRYLLRKGCQIEWSGPNSASHDLTGKDEEFEVKSTTRRYEKLIHISGQFQLQREKRLSIVFCRFEPNINGISINDIVNSLVTELNVSKDDLNSKLSRLGYGEGASVRNEKYQLHEALLYVVDDNFPQITPEMFVTGALPDAIVKLEYDVDLSALNCNVLDV